MRDRKEREREGRRGGRREGGSEAVREGRRESVPILPILSEYLLSPCFNSAFLSQRDTMLSKEGCYIGLPRL